MIKPCTLWKFYPLLVVVLTRYGCEMVTNNPSLQWLLRLNTRSATHIQHLPGFLPDDIIQKTETHQSRTTFDARTQIVLDDTSLWTNTDHLIMSSDEGWTFSGHIIDQQMHVLAMTREPACHDDHIYRGHFLFAKTHINGQKINWYVEPPH